MNNNAIQGVIRRWVQSSSRNRGHNRATPVAFIPLITNKRFESVLCSKPTPDEASVASYNVACCYSKLNQSSVDRFKLVLEEALKSGYEDFMRIRTYLDLENIGKSEDFDLLMKQC
ncbi:BnaC06g41580D [Brassica napus]|uniref:(rape) hypothetical protein n=1 Tax=Brassica napus TaxID=3708 RepID=A0A078J8D4_BRANA|nr:unnamed protein product [Brassica napus]CDY61090.1 BnaC06g41580D [Brassica napus]